jgi:hypothetical protein
MKNMVDKAEQERRDALKAKTLPDYDLEFLIKTFEAHEKGRSIFSNNLLCALYELRTKREGN